MPLMSNFNVNGHDYEIKDAAARGDISTLQNTKEDVANKVTSISNTSTDTEYPSAKAVYTIVSNHDKWQEVTYGTTTKDEIQAILDAGKMPYVWYGDRLHVYAAKTAYYYIFTCVNESTNLVFYAALCSVSNSAWSTTLFSLATTINASSTNYQLPGAKAVYDFVTSSPSKIYAHKVHIEDDGTDPDISFSLYFTITSSSATAISSITGFAPYDGLVYAVEGSTEDYVLGKSVIGYTIRYDDANARMIVSGYDTAASQTATLPTSLVNAVITDTVVQL